MAPLNKVVLVPDLDRLLTIFGEGAACLLRKDTSLDPQWLISLPSAETFEFDVDVRQVVFKFECFGFMFRKFSEIDKNQLEKANFVSEMNHVEFVYNVEWERPALPGEVPEHYEQIARRTGSLLDIPDNATSASVSLIGFIWPQETECGVEKSCALYHDTSETLTVPIFTTESEKIKKLRSVGSTVDIHGLDAWYNELFNWRNRE